MIFEETEEDKQYWNNLYKRLTKHAASQVDWTADHSDEPYGLNSDWKSTEQDTKSCHYCRSKPRRKATMVVTIADIDTKRTPFEKEMGLTEPFIHIIYRLCRDHGEEFKKLTLQWNTNKFTEMKEKREKK